MSDSKFHTLDLSNFSIPKILNNPFYYQPSELIFEVQKCIIEYLNSCSEDFKNEIDLGKMFGFLIVENCDKKLGFLSAFSGQILGKENFEYFVPAIFEYLDPNGFFKVHEAEISNINNSIKEIENSKLLSDLKNNLQQIEYKRDIEISQYQNFIKSEKQKREIIRQNNVLSEVEKAKLISDSQFQKAELKRKKDYYKSKISEIEVNISDILSKISNLKSEREQKSINLQTWLFQQFVIKNYKGEQQNLLQIFNNFDGKIPPSGSGECCAPKLLQYAFFNNYKPIYIAEFWWGRSPIGEIRKHLNFYPACNGRCKPILNFMLQGINYQQNPFDIIKKQDLKIVFEDDFIIVVNKPFGMLSVPGKNSEIESVYSILKQKYNFEPWICHRLDMATSGILIVAKNKETFVEIQKLFENHKIKKTYQAILNGVLNKNSGKISLPLSPDLIDRPRQIVDFENGKIAITNYKVIKIENQKTWIEFYPQTGRTHQLRVHSAHPQGLNIPILGDEIYGTKSDRLYLQAQKISFVHPNTDKIVEFKLDREF